MRGFWKSKTTWLAIGTVLFHVGAVLMGTSTIEQAVQACVVALGAAFMRDALHSHADAVSTAANAAGVGVPLAGDDGEV